MIRSIGTPIGLLACVLFSPRAQAWNKPGHMVSGAIAYRVLQKDSPDVVAKVVALLKKHPYYDPADGAAHSSWKDLIDEPFVKDDERDFYLFMLAARWPDDARDNEDYYPRGAHNDRIHYVNLPFKPDGEPSWVKVVAPDEINVLRGYEDKLGILVGGGADKDRAVALAWVFHLVGDVHQPLHTASLFSHTFQKSKGELVGDRGGTLFFVRAREELGPISLHTLWDGLILGKDRFQTVRNRAIALHQSPELAPKRLANLDEPSFEKWALESYKAAKEVAYKNGELQGSTSKSKAAPVLPDGYAKDAQAVAERRIVTAGYRLAAVLKKAFVGPVMVSR